MNVKSSVGTYDRYRRVFDWYARGIPDPLVWRLQPHITLQFNSMAAVEHHLDLEHWYSPSKKPRTTHARGENPQ